MGRIGEGFDATTTGRRRTGPAPSLGAFAGALAIAGAALVGGVASGSGGPGGAPPAQAPDTALQGAWQDALAASPQMAHAAVSAYAYDVTTGRPLAAVHPDWRLTPASVNKLFTSVAALSLLGPNFRYATTVAKGPGTGGPIYLVGGGDPWLEADGGQTLEAMAKAVAAKVHAASRVVGVSTLYGPTAPGAGWPIGNLPFSYAAPVSALTSARDEVHIVVYPGARAGDPARVDVNPQNPSRPPPAPLLTVTDHALTVPQGRADSVGVTAPAGTNDFTVTGAIPLGAPPLDDYLTLARPALLTAATFEAILVQDGVRFAAQATTGALPAGTQTLLIHRSKPLTKYLQIQNTFSVNGMAESLFRYLGVARSGTGTATAAQVAMASFLAGHALAAGSVHLDGSGLSPYDEASAADVVALLGYAAHQSWFPVLEHSLIHVGRTSQCSFICGLMDGTAADGTVWLKTGNLNNQWNYAGYAQARNGDLIAFAILMDGLPAGQFLMAAEAPIDAMTVDVASYPSESAAAPARTGADTAAPLLPPALEGDLGALTGEDVVGGALVQVAGPGEQGRTAWQLNGGVRLSAGVLPRLAVALAALGANPSPSAAAPAATVLALGRRPGSSLVRSLVLDGRWDPGLTDASLATLARTVAASGIRSVGGALEAVSGPAPSWSGEPYPPDLPWEIASGATAPPAGPLAVDQDQVGILLTPRAGGKVAATTAPAGLPVAVTVAPDGPPVGQTGIAATWLPGTTGFVLSGRTAAPVPQTLTVSAPNPARVALALFRADLARDGVRVAAATLIAAPPAGGAVVATATATALLGAAESSLTAPSAYTTLDLYGSLGPGAARAVAAEFGPLADVPDPAGLGAGDYVTASSVAAMLARAYARGGAPRSLVESLARPWAAAGPEARTAAGILTVGGRTYVYCLIANGLPPAPAVLAALSEGP